MYNIDLILICTIILIVIILIASFDCHVLIVTFCLTVKTMMQGVTNFCPQVRSDHPSGGAYGKERRSRAERQAKRACESAIERE